VKFQEFFEEGDPGYGRRARFRVGLFGALVAALITLPGLWVGTLWDNSETAYSEVAREILLLHDAIVMHLNAAAWFIQPPLYFWLAATSASIFGGTTFAYRLPSALATMAMSAAIAVYVRRYLTSKAARYTALILSTMLMQAVIGRLAIMDALLDACVMISILAWSRAVRGDHSAQVRGASCIIGAIIAALGVLTKGPVALLVPVLVLAPWILWERKHMRLIAPPMPAIVISVAAFFCVAAPWYLLLGAAEGPHGLSELIIHYTFGRYLGTIEKQSGPFYYYLPVLILGIFPWTPFLVPAFKDALSRKLDATHGLPGATLLRLGAVWAVMPLVFFSFAKTKLPNYLAVSLPGIALLCGIWLDDAVVRYRRKVFLAATALPVLIAVLGLAVIVFAHNNALGGPLKALINDAFAFIAMLFCGSAACVYGLMRRSRAREAIYVLGAGTVAAMLVITLSAAPKAEIFKPIPILAAEINRQKQPGDLVALQGVNGENSLIFYTQPPIAVLDSPDTKSSSPQTDPALVLCSAPRVFLVGPLKRPVPDPTYGRRRRLIAQSVKDGLFLIDGPPCETTPE
jgi:4-amino-4-deoxy-L-arabinose transferase-like glycosyltransferase